MINLIFLFNNSYQETIFLPLQKIDKIILGIDPGTLVLGYGLIRVRDNQVCLLEFGVLKLSPKKNPYERLELIHSKVADLIGVFRPNDFAIEAPFFGKNVQSMLKLGRAQGVAIASAIQSGIPVTEYSPKKVKLAITGNGNADKEQVWKMLQNILQIKSQMEHYDASDALAVAVCHHFQDNSLKNSNTKKLNGWGDFLKKNPGRVKLK